MGKVIRSFLKFDSGVREAIYNAYSERELERSTFPFKGQIVDGVIYPHDESIYLIPISTIVYGRAGSSKDLEDNDDEEIEKTEVEPEEIKLEKSKEEE